MTFNAVEFIHRLEGEGLSRGAAETISEAIADRNRELATKSDLAELTTKNDLSLLKAELDAEIAKSATRLVVQFGAMIAVAVAIIGLIVGLK